MFSLEAAKYFLRIKKTSAAKIPKVTDRNPIIRIGINKSNSTVGEVVS